MANSIQMLERGCFAADETRGASPAPSVPARRLSDIELALVTTRAAFDALEDDWNALFARAGRSTQLFQTFNWNWHWANVYLAAPGTVSFAVVTARRNGALVLVWPVVVERSFGLRILAWMGSPVSQYGDVLAENGPGLLPLLRESWSFLLGSVRPDAVKLNKTRADATVAPLLAEAGGIVTQVQEAPYLDLASAPSFEAYAERFSLKDRKNRRRHQRRLQEIGPIALRTEAGGADAAEIAGVAVAMKRAWLDARGLVSPAVADDRFDRFFRAAAASTERPSGLQVSALTCGGKPVATEIAIACRERVAVHVLAYDTAFDKCGPGGLLTEALLASRHSGGVAVFDMLAPGGGYKNDWADASVPVNDHAIGVSLAGIAYVRAYLGGARPHIKAAIEGLPPGWRRGVGRLMRRRAG